MVLFMAYLTKELELSNLLLVFLCMTWCDACQSDFAEWHGLSGFPIERLEKIEGSDGAKRKGTRSGLQTDTSKRRRAAPCNPLLRPTGQEHCEETEPREQRNTRTHTPSNSLI